MRNPRFLVALLSSAILLPVGTEVAAQVVDISGCRAISDRLERFACYEELGNEGEQPRTAAPSARPAAPAPVAPTRVVRAEADKDVESFGRSNESASRIVEGTDGASELIDTIAGLEQIGPTFWEVTLANGQKWRQTEGKRYALQEGDEVRIYPTRWGSDYRLSAERLSGFIQVRRID